MVTEEYRKPTNVALASLGAAALILSIVISITTATDMSPPPLSGHVLSAAVAVVSTAVLSAVAGSTFLKMVGAAAPVDPRTLSVAWLVAAVASSCCGLLIAVFSDPVHALLVACVTAINVGAAIGVVIRASFGRNP